MRLSVIAAMLLTGPLLVLGWGFFPQLSGCPSSEAWAHLADGGTKEMAISKSNRISFGVGTSDRFWTSHAMAAWYNFTALRIHEEGDGGFLVQILTPSAVRVVGADGGRLSR